MSARSVPRQLTLALEHAESLERDDFMRGPSNAEALALIDQSQRDQIRKSLRYHQCPP